ncbi:hypothetical protein EUTSA_v10009645mg [Eutrema salsugineum]|uniref:Potassium channel domain-containing protein n=1 Tax=Eutrema salsugineum TaxID=72664 RepID=V4KG41_EUTSA|nr:two-pore potassium channel 4 [Eutrema salsugineum]ESQ36745.1 hypothetical protein EUTSA_v10009645mg [Eutrema salsugineum]
MENEVTSPLLGGSPENQPENQANTVNDSDIVPEVSTEIGSEETEILTKVTKSSTAEGSAAGNVSDSIEEASADDSLLQTPNEADDSLTGGIPATGFTGVKLMIILSCHFLVGVVMYWVLEDQYSGTKTHPLVDAMYYYVVTITTVGYGDIVPSTVATKIVTVIMALSGVVCLDVFLGFTVSALVNYQEKMTGGTRFTNLVASVFCVFFCITLGSSFLYAFEGLGFWDSVYLSVVSATTVGYRDVFFTTLVGRLFGFFWIPTTTIAMAALVSRLEEIRMETVPPRTDEMKMLSTDEIEMFVTTFLKETGKLDDEDMERFHKKFQDLRLMTNSA